MNDTMLRFVAFVLICVTTAPASARDTPHDSLQLLDAALKQHAAYSDNVTIEAECWSSTGGNPNEMRHTFRRATIWLRDGRIHVRNESWPLKDEPYGDDIAAQPSQRSELLYPYSKEINAIAVSENLDLVEKVVIATLKRTPAEAQRALATVDAGSAALRGYMFGDEASALTLMREMQLSVRPQKERAGDAECWVVEARGEHGHYTAWFDTTRNGALRKLEVEKATDSRFAGRRLGDPDPDHARVKPAEARSPSNRNKSMRITMEITQLAKSGNVEYPSAGKVTITSVHADDSSRSVVHETRQRIDTNLKKLHAHRFEISPIPNGSEVLIRDDNSGGLRHEWQNGRVLVREAERR